MPPWQNVGVSQGVNIPRYPVTLTTLITKTAATAAWDAGASSVQKIAGDGFVEFVATELTKDRCIGLSLTDPNQNYTSIGYGIELAPDLGTGRHYYVYESGVQKIASGANAWTTGDVFRVERFSGNIAYYKNGSWFYGSTAPDQSGSMLVDTSFYNQSGTLDGVRLYDATSKAFAALTWQNIVGATVAAGTSATLRRMTLTAPPKMRTGDQVVVVLGALGSPWVQASNVTWAFADVLRAGDNRCFYVARRRVVDGEPASYTFDLPAADEVVGLALAYRNTDDTAALVSTIIDDIFGATDWPCAKRTTTRVSDLFLGLIMQISNTGNMTIPSDCALRANFAPATTFGFATPRLLAFDFAPEIVGVTDAKHVTASVASSGVAGTVLIAGVQPPGHGLSWLPVAPGAIGLPSDGI